MYVKQESENLWSAQTDVAEVVYRKYFQLVNVLEEMDEPGAFLSLTLTRLWFLKAFLSGG